jgi:K+-transporting ATPase KdpF subunit
LKRRRARKTLEIRDAGRRHAVVHRGFLCRGVPLRKSLPEVEVMEMHMDWITWLGLILSVLLLAYLTVTLLYPEKF